MVLSGLSAATSSSPTSKGKGKAPSVKATTKKPVKASTHPSWKDIIKECIAANRADARSGVSRSTIKKFAEIKYKIDMTGAANSQLNRAISHGAEAGTFVLPKGPSGKVKLAPKVKADVAKENTKPPSARARTTAKPAAKKASATTKPVPAKKATTAKSAASSTGKPLTKKVASTTAKKPKPAATVKKVSSAKSGTKKAAAKVAATKPKAAKVKPSPKKATA